ncbi:MAG: glycosyltransferase [Ignavibacteria bacterium]|nr:glycosyltransferase [Ignavibacteria bacterium]
MTIIEAAASRNIIVSSDFAGVTDILKNGTDGLIFKRNDADDLASKLIFALTNKELTDKMTSVFYEKAKRNFNSGLMCSEHINFYREILK